MLRLLAALLPTLLSAMRSRRDLVLENLALRQQLVVLAGLRHPDIRPVDRVFWVLLRRLWSGWAETLAIVRPDTVVRRHRAGFRIYWNWLSRQGKRSGRPPLPREVRALIRRMATENPWGAPRIHGELLRLGFDVSERSFSRYLRSLPRTPRANAIWGTFLRNHRDGIAAMDFFSVPTAMFRFPHVSVFLVIRHGRRDAARCAVTTSPTAGWVAQQLRETFPFESAACITATPGAKQRRPGRFIQISPPPASAEGDRVPAGRWRRPFTRLATRSRPRSRRLAACFIPLQTPFCSRIVFSFANDRRFSECG
jgi:putative transposase